MRPRRVLVVIGLLVTLTACNHGGRTTCGDFLSMTGKDQLTVVKRMEEDAPNPLNGQGYPALRDDLVRRCTAGGVRVHDETLIQVRPVER
jgi:pyrimidine deaminase RibD-like protein